jgi:hypothetical protein
MAGFSLALMLFSILTGKKVEGMLLLERIVQNSKLTD